MFVFPICNLSINIRKCPCMIISEYNQTYHQRSVFPSSVPTETRRDETGELFPNGGTMTRLEFSGPKAPGNSGMAGLSCDREVDVPERSGSYLSRIFMGKIRLPGNGIRECRPLLITHTILLLLFRSYSVLNLKLKLNWNLTLSKHLPQLYNM